MQRHLWKNVFIVNFEYISLCSSVFIVNFEQVNADWDRMSIWNIWNSENLRTAI